MLQIVSFVKCICVVNVMTNEFQRVLLIVLRYKVFRYLFMFGFFLAVLFEGLTDPETEIGCRAGKQQIPSVSYDVIC